jgi:hypothetical protein
MADGNRARFRGGAVLDTIWNEHPLKYTIQTNKPLALELKRAELVADIVEHIVNVFDSCRLEPAHRSKRDTARMLIGQIVFQMGANLPDEVDDGMLFSKELIEAVPDSYVADYLRVMRKDASILTEAELKTLVAKCDVKNKMISALSELKICAKYINARRVYVLPRRVEDGGLYFVIGKITTEKISKAVYDGMVAEYRGASNKDAPAFADAAICAVILRYMTLGSMGNQLGVPRRIKDLMSELLGAKFELLASSLNHHYENYGSLFYDVEKPFGSCGPINHITPLEGVFISNPPYEHGILETMLDVFLGALATAEKEGKCLIFLFGLPNWHDNPPLPFYAKFRESKYKVCEIEFSGVWESLTTGVLVPLKMTSYRCMMATGLGHRDGQDNPKNIFADIVEEWRAMSAKPIVPHMGMPHTKKHAPRGAPTHTYRHSQKRSGY